MECPICGEELCCYDSFGYYAGYGNQEKCGDIFRCDNEDCEAYQEKYHTHCNNEFELHDGYPC